MTTKPQSETASHTPGPWRIDHNGKDPEEETPRIKGGEAEDAPNVAFIPAYEEPWQRMQANARLIASAPELLSEVRQIAAIAAGMLESDGVSPDWSVVLRDARAAIAKATQP